jgi:4-amino-4-deoxy-L-arabinose transferase-like glycosyltransferase
MTSLEQFLSKSFAYLAFISNEKGCKSLLEMLLVAVACLIWLGLTQGMRPLSVPDGGRYVGVAWEMLRSGNWSTPTLDGLPYFHKPPLFYWITEVSIKLLGANLWAARVAPMLGALLAMLSSYVFIRRWMSASVARAALLILATCPFFYGGAQYANHDMLVAGCITATICFAAYAILAMQQGDAYRAYLIAAWCCAALGLLSKGLIGIALPGAVILLWIVINKDWKSIPRLLWWPAPVLFAAIVFPWFIEMEKQFNGFLYYFFIEQQFHRFIGSGFNNVRPFWFLPLALVALTVPWSPLLLTRLNLPTAPQPAWQASRTLCWVWLIFILVFFSIPESKLIGYILPVLPPLAILIAEGLTLQIFWHNAFSYKRLIPIIIAAVLCVSLIIYLAKNYNDNYTQPLAEAYAAQAHSNEPVVFLDVYPFDFIFYIHVQNPIPVFYNWNNPAILLGDTWQKELLEASFFANAKNKAILRARQDFSTELCAQPVTWVVTLQAIAKGTPLLDSAILIAKTADYGLYRFTPSDQACSTTDKK